MLSLVRTIFAAILLSIAKLLFFGRYLHASAHPKSNAVCFQFPNDCEHTEAKRHFRVAGFVTGYVVPDHYLGKKLFQQLWNC